MAKHGQHDPHGGDPRRRFGSGSGPNSRHEKTHDVRREVLSNPTGLDAEKQAHDAIAEVELQGIKQANYITASDDKELVARFDWLAGEDLSRIQVLTEASPLKQGATYLDLDEPDRGPFTALGCDTVPSHHRVVAKKDVDHELWNQLLSGLGLENF